MTLPRARTLVTGLVGRPLCTYLGQQGRVACMEEEVVVVAGDHDDEPARIRLDDVQVGLDDLAAAGEVALTIDALGPWATYVAAILVEAEGVTFGDFGDAPARVILSGGRRTSPELCPATVR